MFELGTEGAERGEAGLGAGGCEGGGLGVEKEGVLGGGVEGGAGGCGVGAEVGLGECDGEGGVGGEVERGGAFAPVSGEGISLNVRWVLQFGGVYFMTAMLTGAVVLAR